MKIQPQKVYTLSFWAKASESGHGIYCYLWPDISHTGLNGVIYKGINGAGTQEQKLQVWMVQPYVKQIQHGESSIYIGIHIKLVILLIVMWEDFMLT